MGAGHGGGVTYLGGYASSYLDSTGLFVLLLSVLTLIYDPLQLPFQSRIL